MALIGSIALGMSASTSQLGAAFKAASSEVFSFAGLVRGTLTSAFGTASNGLSKFSSAIGTAGAAMAPYALAATALGGGMAVAVKGSLDLMDSTGDLAGRVGVTTEALTALQYAAQLTGSEASVLEGALTKMNDNLANAATKGGPAADALNRIGLDAKELVFMDADKAFLKIVDGIRDLGTQGERTSAAMDLLGKSGTGLMNTINAGSGEISALMEEAKALGMTFTDLDASKAGAANDALDKISGILTGITNTLAIQLAPFITAAGEAFLDFAKKGVNSGESIVTAMEWIATGVGYAADTVQHLGIAFKATQYGITRYLAALLRDLSYLGKGIASVINLIPGLSVSFGETTGIMADEIDTLANSQLASLKDAWNQPWSSEKITSGFNAIKNAANEMSDAVSESGKGTKELGSAFADVAKKVSDFRAKMLESIATVGMSSDQVEIYRLKQAGATDEDLKSISALASQKKALEDQHAAYEKLKEGAKSVIESTMTPLEKFSAKEKELRSMLDHNLISKKQFDLERTKASNEILKTNEAPKQAGAFELGSKELRSSLLAINGQARNDGIKDVAKNTSQQVQLATMANVALNRIANAIGNGMQEVTQSLI